MKALRPPLLLLALPALLLAGTSSGDTLVLDRAAVAAGQCWRLWTGHWVHFSASHLAWNLVAILPAGLWLEIRRPGWLWRHLLVAAPLISVAVLLLEPGLARFGGLSALATSVVTLVGLSLLGEDRADRALGAGLLVLVAAKCALDVSHGTAVFSRFSPGVRPSALAHPLGALAALVLFPVWHRQRVPSAAETTPPGSTRGSRRHWLAPFGR